MPPLPRGFLGTRADVLMDIVIVSLIVIVPALLASWTRVRRGAYQAHRTIQLSLGGTLSVAVSLFEGDLRMAGGIFKLTAPSRFAGTTLLNASIYVHLLFSISTALIWIALTIASLRRFPNPPKPGPFSRTHRLWGRIGMIDMGLTAITGVELYIVGFAY